MFNNSVTLTGNLGARPELRETTAGQTLATVRIAVAKRYKDGHGNYVQDTQWFRITAWGRQAEQMVQQLSTGDRVCFTGRLSCRTYETKEGQKRETVEVTVASFEKLQRLSERRAMVELISDAEGPSGVKVTEVVGADFEEEALPF